MGERARMLDDAPELSSRECEQAVLAASLISPYALGRALERVKDEDFVDARHRLLWSAIHELGSSEPDSVDERTVQALLERWGKFSEAGGHGYIAELVLALPDPNRVDLYVETLKERTTRRRVVDLARSAERAARSGELEAMDLVGRLRTELDRIDRQASPVAQFKSLRVGLEEYRRIAQRPGGEVVGFRTGYRSFDKLTLGLELGQYVTLAARPGEGKSTLALNMAIYQALHLGIGVGVLSLEMELVELTLRALAAESGVPLEKIRLNILTTAERRSVSEAAERLDKAPLWINDAARMTLAELTAKARRLKSEQGLDVLYIDYLQLIAPSDRRVSRNEQVSEVARGMKELAKDLKIVVVALSQLSRSSVHEKRRPGLQDLRDSGEIEQASDVVAFLYREDQEDRERVELVLAKNRGGSTGVVHLLWQPERMRFLPPHGTT